MELNELYGKCAKEQVRNYYKLNLDVFKSLAMDLEDLEQDIMILVWQTYEKIKDKMPAEQITKYIGGTVSRNLRKIITGAIGQESDISLSDFSLKGLNQTDEEVLESLKLQFNQDDPKTAELNYNILYKKLYIGKTDQQIADDLIEEKVVTKITRHRVSDIFRVLRKYRTKGKGLKNETMPHSDDKDEHSINDDMTNRDSLETPLHGNHIGITPSFIFEDSKEVLSKREYEIIEKVFKKGMNFPQIASELNIANTTVSTIYYRAIDKLRKIVKKDVV